MFYSGVKLSYARGQVYIYIQSIQVFKLFKERAIWRVFFIS